MLTKKQAVGAYGAVSALIAGDRENKYVLSPDVRGKMAGNLRRVKKVAEQFQEDRTDLIKNLGTKKDDSDSLEVKLTSPNRPQFDKEIKALNEEDSGIEALTPVTEAELFGAEVVDPKTKEKRPQNQIDIEVLSELIEAGIVPEKN